MPDFPLMASTNTSAECERNQISRWSSRFLRFVFGHCCVNASAFDSGLWEDLTEFWEEKCDRIFRQKVIELKELLKTTTHLLGLEETSSVAYNLGETQTCNYFSYTFRSRRLCRNLRKRVARGGKL